MTLDQLRIFLAVAEREHLTQAAESLNLSPSAVSSAIRALEERYGLALFHRVGRRIEISEAGRALLPEARATLARAKTAEQALNDLSGGLRGSLSVQASQTIAGYWVPPVLVAFRTQYPAVEVDLAIGNTESVARAVLDGAAELGFIEGAIDEPALAQRTVAHDRLLVVVPAGHPWADGRTLGPDQLLAGSWILRERGSGTRSAFEATLQTHGVDPDRLPVVMVLPSNESVRSAVLSGTFAAVMSELVAGPDLAAGRLVAAGLELPLRAFSLLRHKQRYRSKAAIRLEELIAAPATRASG